MEPIVLVYNVANLEYHFWSATLLWALTLCKLYGFDLFDTFSYTVTFFFW